MSLSPLAKDLNEIICRENKNIYEMLSGCGKHLFFPKGIISQSAEAAEHASLYNATIGIAVENSQPMYLESVKKLVPESFSAEEIFPYASSKGLPELRKLWQKRQRLKNPSIKQSSLPMVTNALTHGLSLLGNLFFNPGDQVILPDQFWGNYKLLWGIHHQAQINIFSMFDDQLNGLNLEALQQKAFCQDSDKVVLVLNFPNNPTGYTLVEEESQYILKLCSELTAKGKKVIVVCDDAYAGLSFEESCKKESLFGELSELDSKLLAVKIDGCTKEHFMWGFRVGFVTFGIKGGTEALYNALETKLAGSIRGGISNVNHIGQRVLLESLKSSCIEKEVEDKKSILQARYFKTKEVVFSSKYKNYWDVYPFNSGYFMCLRLKGVEAESVRLELLHSFKVGAIATSKTDLRIAFSCLELRDIEPLFKCVAEAVERLLPADNTM